MTRIALVALLAASLMGCGQEGGGKSLESMTPAEQKKAIEGGPIPPDVLKAMGESQAKGAAAGAAAGRAGAGPGASPGAGR